MRIESTRVWLDETLRPAQLVIENGKITAVEAYHSSPADFDYGDLRIFPGLIDIHCHGFNGMDSNYATRAGLQHWANCLLEEGVTGFMATTSTAPEENLLASHAIIADLIETQSEGARILGIHVEGPQINHAFRGAHNPYLIQKPNIAQFERYQKAARGHIKMICIATEQDDDFTLTSYCRKHGIQVVIGHTGATYAECVNASKAGATSFTHTYNAMLGLHHREPGTVGAALSLDDMYAELICDGVHVHFAACKIAGRMKGKDKLILITDSVQIKGLKPGIYDMPGRWVEVKEDGCGRLKDGRLAGSSNKLINMVKNMVEACGLPLATAINAATVNPATYIGCTSKGVLAPTYDADIIVIDDAYTVKQTYVGGQAQLAK